MLTAAPSIPPSCRALTSLDISDNRLCGYWKTPDFSGYQALVAAIEQHPLLTMDAVDLSEVLDVSDQNLGVGGAKAVAEFITGNGALETITFGDEQAVTMKTIMTEADFSGKQLGASGAIIVAAFLPKCQ